jgi:hypothetical protein
MSQNCHEKPSSKDQKSRLVAVLSRQGLSKLSHILFGFTDKQVLGLSAPVHGGGAGGLYSRLSGSAEW